MVGIDSKTFSSNDAYTTAFENSVALSYDENSASKIRISVTDIIDIVTRRLLTTYHKLDSNVLLASNTQIRVDYLVSFTFEDFKFSSVDELVSNLQRNFTSKVSNGGFKESFVFYLNDSGIDSRNLSQLQVTDVTFGPTTVNSTTDFPSSAPTSIPTIIPTGNFQLDNHSQGDR